MILSNENEIILELNNRHGDISFTLIYTKSDIELFIYRERVSPVEVSCEINRAVN
jgi:hypothetical protein